MNEHEIKLCHVIIRMFFDTNMMTSQLVAILNTVSEEHKSYILQSIEDEMKYV